MVAYLVFGVGIGLEVQQQLHQVMAPLLGRDGQRPLPACVGSVGVGAVLEEALDIFVLAELQLRDERVQGGLGLPICPGGMSLNT